jgi:SWI2/SNF2 ATPase
MRYDLPHASFFGLAGTPIELAGANVCAVFGDYSSAYEVRYAQQDDATVPIYCEKRLARLAFDEFVKRYNPENRHTRKATWSEKLDCDSAAETTAKGKKGGAPHPSPLPASGARGLTGKWRAYTYDEIASRDKASLDIFWLRDESLEDSDNLPPPAEQIGTDPVERSVNSAA